MGTARSANADILKGTLDVLILKALSGGPAHGYTIATWIASASGDALALGEGTLYPALHRLEARGWVRSRWGTSANNRQAKFYTLTRKGEAQLTLETRRWQRSAAALFSALAAPAPGASGTDR
jgi:PadR family transcriptional regulator PadR